MSKVLLPECEYCYLNNYRVFQSSVGTVDYWDVSVSISCDLLDSDKKPIPMVSNMANTTLVVSGTTVSGMHTLSGLLSYKDEIETAVNNYVVWAKEEYAGYTG